MGKKTRILLSVKGVSPWVVASGSAFVPAFRRCRSPPESMARQCFIVASAGAGRRCPLAAVLKGSADEVENDSHVHLP